MQAMRRAPFLLVVLSFVVSSVPAVAQLVLATLPVGQRPTSVAINEKTNKIYVLNPCGNDLNCVGPVAGTVTVIDGATNNTQTVNVGYGYCCNTGYYPVAVNSATNKIYVVNECGNDPNCASPGTVTVIDGATNDTASVQVGYSSISVAVNSATNKIYVVNVCISYNSCGTGTVTVIDGATNNTTTVTVGDDPLLIAINSASNEIYVVNQYGGCCNTSATVTVIDGATNNTATINVGYRPDAIAINSANNKIYVLNSCGNDSKCGSPGTVTVIDGATNNTQTVNVGYQNCCGNFGMLAINSANNKVYVANPSGNSGCCNSPGTVTIIDSANNTTTVTAGYYTTAVAVNSATNKIYVGNECADQNCFNGSVTVIDGATNNTTTIGTPSVYGTGSAVDSQANKIYFPGSGVLTVVDGASSTALTLGVGNSYSYNGNSAVLSQSTHRVYLPSSGENTVLVVDGEAKLQFLPVTPCRVVDTRNPNGTFGGPPIQGGTQRDFPIPLGSCDIPGNAIAYALNVTVVPHGPLGYLTIWPTSEYQPYTSTMNSVDGRVKANAVIVQGGVSAAVSVYVTNTTDVVLDINGYFAPAGNSTLAFYPLPPCRVADTRDNNYPQGLGPPSLSDGVPRDFPILMSTCGIPNTAQAYSFNFTAVPPGPLGYLTVWPAGQNQPVVSTLNDVTGTVVANAAIVPAGTGGDIDVFASNNTDVVIDVNGYFAPPNSGPNPLSLYTLRPCRSLDTRNGTRGGWFDGEFVADILDSYCEVSDQANAYVLNATAIPRVTLGYLTLWPDGENQPLVSTLNAIDGAITSNMAIVPNLDGFTDAYATNLTQLILDLSGYFAP